jgi:hypothetical protein
MNGSGRAVSRKTQQFASQAFDFPNKSGADVFRSPGSVGLAG